jgi:hypothetical protein
MCTVRIPVDAKPQGIQFNKKRNKKDFKTIETKTI